MENLTESFVFSPLSIALALSLVHVAAKGETRDEIRKALLNGATDEELEQHFSNISAGLLVAEKGTEVNVANHIFSRKTFTIKKLYLNDVKKLYNAGASQLNFEDQEASAEAINNFVSENTKGHIKKIINPDSISEELVAVLTNAFYFKANWQTKFKKESTYKREFFSSENSKRETEFLHSRNSNRKYSENGQFQVLSLPYKDTSFALSIFLPKTRFGLSEALQNLDSVTIQQLMSNTSNTLVNIAMPKWKIETALGLNRALMAVGIEKAFTDSADLSNFADGIYISQAAHKALIEVDEDGTVAAAATTISFSLTSVFIPAEEPIEFTADHPFLFILSKDNHPLFIGIHN